MYNDLSGCTFDRLKCLADDMLTRLCQHLDRHIFRDHILLNQCTHQLIFCLGCCRETDLNFLESDINKHLEKLQLFVQTHRLNQRLIAITQIHTAPDRCFIYIFFFCPVHADFRGHKIISLVLLIIKHRLSSIPCRQTFIFLSAACITYIGYHITLLSKSQ